MEEGLPEGVKKTIQVKVKYHKINIRKLKDLSKHPTQKKTWITTIVV